MKKFLHIWLVLLLAFALLTPSFALAGVYDDPIEDGAAVTPHNTDPLPAPTRGLFIGGAGNLTVVTVKGTTLTLTGVTAGSLIPIRATIVKATGTTATNITAVW